MRKDWKPVDARDIVGDGPNLNRDMELLSLSLMPKKDRDAYLKEHHELLSAWNKIEESIQKGKKQ
jgi:hypothetical protein